jgi:hypothetical protein
MFNPSKQDQPAFETLNDIFSASTAFSDGTIFPIRSSTASTRFDQKL